MRALKPAAVFAFVAAVFLPCLGLPFLDWDDYPNVAANPLLTFDRAGLEFMLTGTRVGHWHPLTWISLALDRAAFGPGPFGHHLTNVLLHAGGAVLLYFLALRLEVPAWPAALLWAVHPLRVESVAWVSERRDVLCGVLALGAALAYCRGDRDGRRLALALSAGAMAAKVFAVVLPAVWLVLDARLEGRPRWREKLAYLPFCALASACGVLAQRLDGAAVPLEQFGPADRLAQAFYGLAFYARKSVLPLDLAPLYERPIHLEPGVFAASASAVLVACALLFLARRRAPGAVLAALAYAILLLPALGFFKSGRAVAADRWSYLACIPLSLLAAAALRSLLPLAGAAVLGLAVLTRAQIPVWASETALWSRAADVSPWSAFSLQRLSEAEAAAGRESRAFALRARADAVRARLRAASAPALPGK